MKTGACSSIFTADKLTQQLGSSRCHIPGIVNAIVARAETDRPADFAHHEQRAYQIETVVGAGFQCFPERGNALGVARPPRAPQTSTTPWEYALSERMPSLPAAIHQFRFASAPGRAVGR